MRRHTACLLIGRRWVGSLSAYSWVGILSLLMSRPTTCLLRELDSRTSHRLGTEVYWELFGRASQALFECTCRVGPVKIVSFTTLYVHTKFGGLKVCGTPCLYLRIVVNFSSCSFSQFFVSIAMPATLVLLLNPKTHFRSWSITLFTALHIWELFNLFTFAIFWFYYDLTPLKLLLSPKTHVSTASFGSSVCAGSDSLRREKQTWNNEFSIQFRRSWQTFMASTPWHTCIAFCSDTLVCAVFYIDGANSCYCCFIQVPYSSSDHFAQTWTHLFRVLADPVTSFKVAHHVEDERFPLNRFCPFAHLSAESVAQLGQTHSTVPDLTPSFSWTEMESTH